mgnify:CR=1 FL=1
MKLKKYKSGQCFSEEKGCLYARKLRKGDKVAIVSLSRGMLGEEFCSHNIEIGVKRLKEYGLESVFMPYTLKSIECLRAHPEARAKT